MRTDDDSVKQIYMTSYLAILLPLETYCSYFLALPPEFFTDYWLMLPIRKFTFCTAITNTFAPGGHTFIADFTYIIGVL
jgi:hypothetical protein